MADIVIQAGHCHRRSGSTGTRSFDGDPTEQEFAWAVATAAATRLTARGHSARAIVADPQLHEYRGQVFVAIHCDGSTSSSAHGASTGYRTDEGRDLAVRWKNAYAARGWVGFRSDNYTAALQGYYGCKRAIEQGNRRALIVECGFLTNPSDEAQLASKVGQARVIDALIDAIEQTHPAPNPVPQEDDMSAEAEAKIDDIYNWVAAVCGIQQRTPGDNRTRRGWDFERFDRNGKPDSSEPPRPAWMRWDIEDVRASRQIPALVAQVAGLTKALEQVTAGNPADIAEIKKAMTEVLDKLTIKVDLQP